MNVETKTQTEAAVALDLPPNNLPAIAEPVRQERKPRVPRTLGPQTYSPKIARAVLKVSRELGRIQKDGYNDFQKYKYTRWEDINEQLQPLLVENGLVIIQNEISRDVIDRSAKGNLLAIIYHFTLVNEDGESWPPSEFTAIARLIDSKGTPDDKAASKCHTQAEKQFCVKQFKIRTDDYLDGDAVETLSRQNPVAKETYHQMESQIRAFTSVVELAAWGRENRELKRTLKQDWQDSLTAEYNNRMETLRQGNVEWTEDGVVDPKTGEVVA